MSARKDVWAVVPIKGGTDAKQRLAPVLTPNARRELAVAMAENVVAALAGASSLAGILVVTTDAQAAALATRVGGRVCRDGATEGHTRAVASAADLLVREGRGAMLSLPADLPLVTTADIERVIAARRTAPDLVIVPARDLGGTNAVLCSPPDVVKLQFGEDSFRRHLAAARDAGVEPQVVRVPGIELDVDLPADLDEWQRRVHLRARAPGS